MRRLPWRSTSATAASSATSSDAGRAAHEHLDAGASRQPLQVGEFADVLRRRADEEGDVDPGAALGATALVGEIGGADRRRLGVRHLEDGGDAADRRGGGAGGEVLLVFEAGLAEVDLGVDDAGQDVQAGAVDVLLRIGAAEARRTRRYARRGRRRRSAPAPPGVATTPARRIKSNSLALALPSHSIGDPRLELYAEEAGAATGIIFAPRMPERSAIELELPSRPARHRGVRFSREELTHDTRCEILRSGTTGALDA